MGGQDLWSQKRHDLGLWRSPRSSVPPSPTAGSASRKERSRLVLLLSVVPTLWARLRTVIELGGERLPRQQGGVDFCFEFLIRRPQAHGHRRTQPHTPPSPPSPSPPSSRLLTSARRPRLRRPRLPPSSLGRADFAAIATIAASTLAPQKPPPPFSCVCHAPEAVEHSYVYSDAMCV